MNHLEKLPFPKALNEFHRETLTERAQELGALIGESEPPSRAATRDKLQEIWTLIKDNKNITEFPLPAMLSHGPGDYSVQRIQAHVCVASLNEIARNRSQEQIIRACVKVRQMHTGEAPHLVKWAKNVPMGSTDDVLVWIKKEIEAFGKEENGQMMKDAIAPFDHLFERYINNRVIVKDGGPKRELQTIDLAAGIESEMASAQRQVFIDPHIDGDVENSDNFLSYKPSGTRSQRSSAAIQQHRSRQAYLHTVRNYIHDPNQWSALTDHSLKGLIRELLAGVSKRIAVDVFLMMSLLTGRDSLWLSTLPVNPYAAEDQSDDEYLTFSGRRFALRTTLALPKPKIDSDLVDPYRPAKKPFLIPLPNEINRALTQLGSKRDISESDFRLRAKLLRERYPKITLQRVMHTAYHRMVGEGHNHTHLDRLFGTDVSRSTPLWYEHMSESTLLELYASWVNLLNTFLPERGLTLDRKENKGCVGSNKTPEVEEVKAMFEALRSRTERLRKFRDISRAHKHYVVYIYKLLSFATGLRPAEEAPFELLDYFCFSSRKAFLQDKDHHQPAPRWVPLASFAVEQLELYIDYLKPLRSRLHGEQRAYVDRALRAEVPFLFTLEPKGRARSLTSKVIREVLEPFWPFDLNWPRHYLRSELIPRGAGDDVVRAFMGHGEMGQEPFARHSKRSTRRLRTVVPLIEAMADEVGLEPLGGRNV